MTMIGIIGSRRRNTDEDERLVCDAFWEIYKEGDIIVSGGCPKGGDRFAKNLHHNFKIPYLEFPADWGKYGKSAGFVRNTSIAEWSDVIVACVAKDRTGGTEDTIKKAKSLEKGIVIV